MENCKLVDILEAASCKSFKDQGILIYLVAIHGDPQERTYGADGEGLDCKGHPRTCTAEKARMISDAAAEVVTFAASFDGDEDLSNSSYEYKQVYIDRNGKNFILGPKSYKKKIYLSSFN